MSVRRTLGSWLLVIAMTISGLIPYGFMPEVDADTGILEMVICTEHGAVTIRIGPDGEPLEDAPEPSDGQKVQAKCAFAVNNVPMAPVSPAFSAPIETQALDGLGGYDHQQHAGHGAVAAILARGPPATA